MGRFVSGFVFAIGRAKARAYRMLLWFLPPLQLVRTLEVTSGLDWTDLCHGNEQGPFNSGHSVGVQEFAIWVAGCPAQWYARMCARHLFLTLYMIDEQSGEIRGRVLPFPRACCIFTSQRLLDCLLLRRYRMQDIQTGEVPLPLCLAKPQRDRSVTCIFSSQRGQGLLCPEGGCWAPPGKEPDPATQIDLATACRQRLRRRQNYRVEARLAALASMATSKRRPGCGTEYQQQPTAFPTPLRGTSCSSTYQ